jgi:hypothetical protein
MIVMWLERSLSHLPPWKVHDATFIFTQDFRLATLAARLLKRVLRGGKVLEMSAPALSVG